MEKMRNVLDPHPGDPFRRQLPGYGGPYLLAGIYQVSFKKSVVLVRGAGVLYVRVDGPFRGVPGDW